MYEINCSIPEPNCTLDLPVFPVRSSASSPGLRSHPPPHHPNPHPPRAYRRRQEPAPSPRRRTTQNRHHRHRTRAQSPTLHHQNRPAQIPAVAAPSSPHSPPIPASISNWCPQSWHPVTAPSSRRDPNPDAQLGYILAALHQPAVAAPSPPDASPTPAPHHPHPGVSRGILFTPSYRAAESLPPARCILTT
ncbi:hypothetical protein PVAP13_6NG220806 [Panicum virgatum]|uniref:Uncharacterized protein n=1 Tax=Panicum virgatum TaxID=38727 RepID=A0A8T0QYG5_PANVG|nr:hypothetical protein PVAP13_6NG220806 [Panicum virgatum]